LVSAVPYPKCELKGAPLVHDSLTSNLSSLLAERKGHGTAETNKGGNMKRLLALVTLAVCVSAPSFGADVVGHSAKVAGKDTYKVAKASAMDTGKAAKSVVKFLF
jgi:hypothetical protein